ncbi:MAG: hypothetical protein WC052_00720 [Patescibacteria group bacterium]
MSGFEWLLVLLVVKLVAVTYFLASEMLKKFGFMQQFIAVSNCVVTWEWRADEPVFEPAMWKVMICHPDCRQFGALIGFKLNILGYTGFDYYGYVQSDEQGRAVFSTWLGRKPCTFQFLVGMDASEFQVASICEETIGEPATARFPPHWWQRFSFFA